ncbi:ABC transporter permease [Amycolatopsis sp. GM8]|uniref:ABC transporter permease n=1 Tax=Amycolatopsis sp. GM8 TaxID=2896530 RepID=UPI001F24C998|nr:ABC transporter permease [Amycolatopsis sp. GM8]
MGLVLLLAIFANLLPLADPGVRVGAARLMPFHGHSADFWLGTDTYGRSVLARLVYGARASLLVATVSTVLGCVVGGILGLVAGYFRGPFDVVMGFLTDTLLAFPGLIMLLALAAAIGPGEKTLIIGLTLIAIPLVARVSRANTIRFASREFVETAQVLGARPGRVLYRELAPNVLPPVLGYSVIVMATLIVAEAALSFLGVGIRPPTPSWGVMIADGQFELYDNPQLVVIPALVLFITVYMLNNIGEWIRGHFDISESKI